MTHPVGNLTFFPHANFTFSRAYVNILRWRIESNLVYTQADNLFTFQYTPLPSLRAYVKLRDKFWEWNSKSWHLDSVVEYAYEKVDPTAPETDVTLQVFFEYDVANKRYQLGLNTVSPSIISYLQLPPRNRDYWLYDPD